MAQGTAEAASEPALSRRRAETRDRLMDAAITVFAQVGVDQARLEDISEEAGFTRGAFYSNFTDKDDLIVALLQRQISRASEVIETSLDQALAQPQPESFDEMIGSALDAVTADGPVDDWLLAEQSLRLYALRNETVAAKLRTYEAQHRARMSEILDGVLERTGIRSTMPMDHLVAIVEAIHSEATIRRQPGQAKAAVVAQARELMISFLTSCLTPPSESVAGP